MVKISDYDFEIDPEFILATNKEKGVMITVQGVINWALNHPNLALEKFRLTKRAPDRLRRWLVVSILFNVILLSVVLAIIGGR